MESVVIAFISGFSLSFSILVYDRLRKLERDIEEIVNAITIASREEENQTEFM